MSSNEQTAVVNSPYGYVPTKAVQIALLVLFALSMFAHLVQALRPRARWLLPTVVNCGLLEALAYSARLWSSFHPSVKMLYSTQLVLGLIAPTHFMAANFIIFRNIMKNLGFAYSSLKPKTYSIIFYSTAIISLAVQSGSGGLTAINSKHNFIKLGGYIALAGTIIQTVMIVAFLTFAIDYLVRYTNDKPVKFAKKEAIADRETLALRGDMNTGLRWMIMAIMFSTLCLLIRGIFRIVELAGGLQGKISQTQIYTVIFDGVLVLLAMITLNVAHPSNLLPAPQRRPSE